jgi:hypothetical protein
MPRWQRPRRATMSNDSPPTFVLVLRPLPHVDVYRALRMALKFLLRRFGGGEDRRRAQSVSLLGVKRTSAIAVQMSAFDPKRTLADMPLERFCCLTG